MCVCVCVCVCMGGVGGYGYVWECGGVGVFAVVGSFVHVGMYICSREYMYMYSGGRRGWGVGEGGWQTDVNSTKPVIALEWIS